MDEKLKNRREYAIGEMAFSMSTLLDFINEKKPDIISIVPLRNEIWIIYKNKKLKKVI